jgi:hypothetical protein
MHRWYTKEEIAFVKKTLKGRSYLETLKMFNEKYSLSLTLRQFITLAYKHKLRNGIGKYKPGNIPFRKGKKFPRKHHPAYKPIGTERTTVGYVEIKTGRMTWTRKGQVLWKKAHGKIPKNHIVCFADGDKSNFDLNNLLLVSRGEHGVMNKNGLRSSDRDLTVTGKILANLMIINSEKKRKLKEKRG